jgi:D-xylose 1-dehydrogenase (NADP+, D-xylono-1,5-lactone-forming)
VRRDLALGGGSIWDVGCYPISLARFVADAEPTVVFGHAINGPTGIDEGFAGQLMFGDALHAQFDSGFRAPFRTHAEIVGTTGAIHVLRPFKPTQAETVIINRGDRVEELHVTSHEELYLPEIEDLGRAILEGTPPRVSLADSRGNVATILALLESARTRQPVTLAR